ncbi:MAG: phasin family protein [Thermostichales cyanobacterium DRC_bins_46]
MDSLLQQLLLLGIGTTSLVAEQAKKAADELVKRGQLDPKDAKEALDSFLGQLKAEQSNFEAQLQRQIRNVMQDLGVPNQREMDELRGRLDRLERQVSQLENKVYSRTP